MSDIAGATFTELIPGDVEVLFQMQTKIEVFAQGFDAAADHLEAIADGREWVGEAADTFTAQYDKHLKDTANSTRPENRGIDDMLESRRADPYRAKNIQAGDGSGTTFRINVDGHVQRVDGATLLRGRYI